MFAREAYRAGAVRGEIPLSLMGLPGPEPVLPPDGPPPGAPVEEPVPPGPGPERDPYPVDDPPYPDPGGPDTVPGIPERPPLL